MKSVPAIVSVFMSHTESINAPNANITYAVVKKRIEAQRRTKVYSTRTEAIDAPTANHHLRGSEDKSGGTKEDKLTS